MGTMSGTIWLSYTNLYAPKLLLHFIALHDATKVCYRLINTFLSRRLQKDEQWKKLNALVHQSTNVQSANDSLQSSTFQLVMLWCCSSYLDTAHRRGANFHAIDTLLLLDNLPNLVRLGTCQH